MTADSLSTEQAAVLKVLAYYDCFDFPLTRQELEVLLQDPAREETIDLALRGLIDQRAIEEVIVDPECNSEPQGEETVPDPAPPENKARDLERYYLLAPDATQGGETSVSTKTAALVERRRQGEATASTLWPTITKQSSLIARFPFVRAVALSGSLSKGTHFAGDDVDFFLITSAKRVWTCRLLLMLYKRIALKGSHDHFCINYLVSESQLAVPDKNLFTATEIAWLVPMNGHALLQRFVNANDWMSAHLPRCPSRIDDQRVPWRRPWHRSQEHDSERQKPAAGETSRSGPRL